jgi:hypothetical protein
MLISWFGLVLPAGSPEAIAYGHTLLAIAVGEGRLVLASAGPQAQSTSAFTLRIRVLRGHDPDATLSFTRRAVKGAQAAALQAMIVARRVGSSRCEDTGWTRS